MSLSHCINLIPHQKWMCHHYILWYAGLQARTVFKSHENEHRSKNT